MANIHPYLTFNNTKEALDYYKDVLGATNISRLPLAEEQAEQFGVPIEKASDLTMHSQCDILGSTIMAADNFMKVDPLVYDSISILIDLDSEDEQAVSQADAFWNKAVESGTVTVNYLLKINSGVEKWVILLTSTECVGCYMLSLILSYNRTHKSL